MGLIYDSRNSSMVPFLPPFLISRLPRIIFGAGKMSSIAELAASHGTKALLITGARSFEASAYSPVLLKGLEVKGITAARELVTGEPSPDLVDGIVQRHRAENIDVVIGVGGGSTLDAAKAVAGLLPGGHSVMHFLEGVGRGLPYKGPSLPMLAVPTTAGTGSEATKNAVISIQGNGGFKKSFRDELLVPHYAIIDPDLLASCPKPQIAANALDALTQLIESYVASGASPITDALNESAICAVRDGLFAWYDDGPDAAEGRACMAYAALISGICLAQSGLGAVHGLASPLGAFFPIPHGVACGAVLAASTRMNILAMSKREPGNPARKKYARVAYLLTEQITQTVEEAHNLLVTTLHHWTEQLCIPGLRRYGVTENDLPRIVDNCRGGSMKTNPIVLTDQELTALLEQCR